MSTNKIIQALGSAAGGAGGAGLNVEEVFSTYLYDPTGSSMTITNDIDLAGEGGLVWLKNRASDGHHLFDTERGATYDLRTNETSAQSSIPNSLTSFNSNGFSIGNYTEINSTNQPVASWTFRKAPKFFDVVTYTGDGTLGRTISHNLGSVPGFIIIKRTSSSGSYFWSWHNYFSSFTSGSGHIPLGSNIASSDSAAMFGTHSSTSFTVQNNSNVNASGSTYVAYLFAHNNGDGEFGPTGDQDIIKCGSFTDSSSGWSVDLGFEPQFLLTKRADSTGNWEIVDTMRGFTADRSYTRLYPNLSNAEQTVTKVGVNSTGFFSTTAIEADGATIIYIAIRRGPMGIPESATDVFYAEEATNPNKFVTTGFVTDLALQKHTALSSSWYLADRLRGQNKWLSTNTTGAELVSTDSTYYTGWDYMNGVDMNIYPSQSNNHIFHMWKRAPSFFDVVAYTGDGTTGRTVSHNLGVAPEMMWVKRRDGSKDWFVYHSDVGAAYSLKLNLTNAAGFSGAWNSTAPSDTSFTVGNGTESNYSNYTYIAYLFASLDGISKVGSYTGNGTSQTIDCGFSSGARFVLIKGSSFADNWWVFDTERGIVAGDDPRLYLNTTGAEFSFDYIDPYSSGFTVNSFLSSNGQSYIFYAIA